jgi:hypothetical protein
VGDDKPFYRLRIEVIEICNKNRKNARENKRARKCVREGVRESERERKKISGFLTGPKYELSEVQ